MSKSVSFSRWDVNAAFLLILFISTVSANAQPLSQPNKDAQALQEFHNRIQQYLAIHHHADTIVPHISPTHSAKKIIDRRHALAAEIAKERGAIPEGNIFTPEVDAYFDRLIRAAYRANVRGIEASLECLSLIREEKLKPNDIYPEGAGYIVMPSTILLHVPQMPPELEYRIINKDLIVRDREANLIVDILRNAIPPSSGRKLCDD